MERLRNATASITSFSQAVVREHTTAFAVGSTGLALVTAPITGPTVLGAIGFGASGPVAASIATAWHSSIGIVQAGSLFSTLQGAGMGAAAGTFTTISNIGIGLAGSAVVGSQWTGMKETSHAKHDIDIAGHCDDGQLSEDDLEMPEMEDTLGKEFAKFLKIDMS
ncbi:hypothetical protein ASPWEDRAFT_46942 [Aspergillus wentii DTO 134E9]|uniref:Uncharacterized protein n=1 Tax=Aspergillus wentii DTO 134E9 TaxID=1073089 RepID=A0A1L9R3N5_ASPWE|nr:uncharacterized protein ASPWEDRAFT_46942 [Aspergillus wentii DTO 134E9]OJJ29539.1 hypothetical protein ASPWEDRAFT_46942 [Aspergillus wentii DTO 134E9]